MRKSTILVLVIVYVLSFLAIGLLGQAVRAYNPTIYPESITITEVDGIAKVTKDAKGGYDYYFTVRNYKDGTALRLKAEVKPENTSYPDVDFIKDDTDTTFSLNTKTTDSSIEKNYAVITLNVSMDNLDPTVETANFMVSTTTPGDKIILKIGITFANY